MGPPPYFAAEKDSDMDENNMEMIGRNSQKEDKKENISERNNDNRMK